MYFNPFYVNCSEWSCRTEVFTCSATYALMLIYSRYLVRFLIRWIRWYHCDCLGWAVAGAVSASYAICIDDTIVKVDNCDADLYR